MEIKDSRFYGTMKVISWNEYIKGNYRYEETIEIRNEYYDVVLNLDTLEYFCVKEA